MSWWCGWNNKSGEREALLATASKQVELAESLESLKESKFYEINILVFFKCL